MRIATDKSILSVASTVQMGNRFSPIIFNSPLESRPEF